jgi:multicomponent Na+:H+ antiporter subunit D
MSLLQQLPALQVAVPLIGAPLCALMVRPQIAYVFAVLVSWVTFAISLVLLVQVLDPTQPGPIVYAMGGWAAPWGIVYVIDPRML